MTSVKSYKQQGVVLVITLVMLLALTLLAISSMRGVSLETRITATHIEERYLENLADAALREGEYNFYGPVSSREKLESNVEFSCAKGNIIKSGDRGYPCLFFDITDEQLTEYFLTPIKFINKNNASKYNSKNTLDMQDVNSITTVAWVPYHGFDQRIASNDASASGVRAYWSSFRIKSEHTGGNVINPEYGAGLEGDGVFYYLITAQAKNTIAAQSTIAVIYLGINN